MRTNHGLRRRVLTAIITTALALSFTAVAGAAPQQVGVLTGTSGCEMVIGGSVGCTPAAGIAAGESVVVSPDGRNVYATNFAMTSPSAPAGLAAFSRDPLTGALTQLPGTSGCMTRNGNSAAGALTCSAVPNYGGGDSANIAITPDGKFVYVVNSSNIILIFARDPATGALTQPPGAAGCVTPTGSGPCQMAPHLTDPQDVSVSPDGKFLYVSELVPDGILVLSRDASTGALNEVQCMFDAPAPGGCDTGRDVGFSEPVVISPDGAHVFSSEPSTGISSLTRDPVTGLLTQAAGAAGCISEDGTDGHGGACAQARFLENPVSMAISPDGHTLYAVTNNFHLTAGVAVLDVAADGSLSQPAGSQACITNNGKDQTGAANCATGRALDAAFAAAISPDGGTLYVSNQPNGGGDGVATLTISPSTGALSEPDGTAGCTTADGSSGGVSGVCGISGPAMNTPEASVVSPDGSSFYVSAASALIGLRRTVVACQPTTTSTAFQTAVTVAFSCTDGNGKPLTVSVASQPSHGSVGAVNQSTPSVTYTPAAGYSGPDSFTFTASDGTFAGAAQTATITVGHAVSPLRPQFSKVGQSHRTWREHGKAKRHAPPVGTTFRFTLNTAARVTLTFAQQLPGRRTGGRCAAPSKRNKGHRACTRAKVRGSVSFNGATGANRRAFNGAIRHHGRLPLGSYTVTLTATAKGLHARPKTLHFTIVG